MATLDVTSSHNGRHIKEDGTFYNVADFHEMTMGGRGFVVITDTSKTDSAAGYSFVALQCLTDVVIDEYTTRAYAPITPADVLEGVTIPSGTMLYGQFTSITLTSGTLICYNGVNNAGI